MAVTPVTAQNWAQNPKNVTKTLGNANASKKLKAKSVILASPSFGTCLMQIRMAVTLVTAPNWGQNPKNATKSLANVNALALITKDFAATNVLLVSGSFLNVKASLVSNKAWLFELF